MVAYGLGRDTNSGLKPFYKEISLKNGGRRTSEYLENRIYFVRGWSELLHLFFAMTSS